MICAPASHTAVARRREEGIVGRSLRTARCGARRTAGAEFTFTLIRPVCSSQELGRRKSRGTADRQGGTSAFAGMSQEESDGAVSGVKDSALDAKPGKASGEVMSGVGEATPEVVPSGRGVAGRSGKSAEAPAGLCYSRELGRGESRRTVDRHYWCIWSHLKPA